MNTHQIDDLLRCIKGFACGMDALPKSKVTPPFYCTLNTSPTSSEGEHWLGVCLKKGENGNTLIYMDSLGLPPYSKEIIRFANNNASEIIFNKFPLQHPSSAFCAHYCVLFLHSMAHGSTAEQFLAEFAEEPRTNDAKVRRIFEKVVGGTSIKTGGQVCRALRALAP